MPTATRLPHHCNAIDAAGATGGIDGIRGARRHAIKQLTLLAAVRIAATPPALASAPLDVDRDSHLLADLAATWQAGGQSYVGLLSATVDGMKPIGRQKVPTRAHGIVVGSRGTVLVAARRPGDWLLRFDPRHPAAAAWCWSDGAHTFNGHVIRSRDGRRLFSTETSRETGAGSIGVRDAESFDLLGRWPSAGIDPHELVLGPDGGLWVANGGIETRPETGRTKHHLDRMDSSLVCLDDASGRIRGQWRLEDRRLGLRHLAFGADGVLGIALQAEHDDAETTKAAPVLAIWDRRRGLRPVPLPSGVMLAGYGGAIARVGERLAVSCPRADRVASWRMVAGEPRWQAPLQLSEACALAGGWCGGAGAVLHAGSSAGSSTGNSAGSNAGSNAGKGTGVGTGVVARADGAMPVERMTLPVGIRLDNHWALAQAG